MAVENPIFEVYRDLVSEAKSYAFLSKADDQFEVDAQPLIMAVQAAQEAGFNNEAILAAIREGELKGILEIVDPGQQVEDNAYWAEVRAEAEGFWARRYDPDAPEDW